MLEKQGVDVKVCAAGVTFDVNERLSVMQIEAIASEYVNILQIDSRKTQSSRTSQDVGMTEVRSCSPDFAAGKQQRASHGEEHAEQQDLRV